MVRDAILLPYPFVNDWKPFCEYNVCGGLLLTELEDIFTETKTDGTS